MVAGMLRQFADEVSGAREYARCAEECPDHAQMYRQMAQAEVEHARSLAQAVRADLGRQRTPDEAATCLAELAAGIGRMLDSEVRSLEA